MHAMARLLLHGAIDHVQTSWVKLGVDGTRTMLDGGANDLGGTLMEETISRMAGSQHGSRRVRRRAARRSPRPPAGPPGSAPRRTAQVSAERRAAALRAEYAHPAGGHGLDVTERQPCNSTHVVPGGRTTTARFACREEPDGS